MVKVMSRYGSGQHSYITSFRVAGTPGNIIDISVWQGGAGGGTGHNKAGTCKLVTLMKFTSQSDGIKNINVREGEEHFSNFHSYLSYKL